MNKPKDAPILRLVRPDEGGPDPDDPDETDVRFLDAVTDDLQDLIVRTTVPLDELFPEDDTLENAIRIARLTAFARALVDGAPLPPRPPRPSPPPRPAPTMSTRLRLALFRSMLKHLAGDGHPDVTALVDAYDRGLAGEEAAAAAGLEPVRRDRAIVGVKRLVDDCDRLLDEPAQLH